MKKIFIGTSFLFMTLSCTTSKPSTPDNSKEVAHIMIPKSGCYKSTSGNDIFYLKIETFPNVVTGILKYDFSEKDDSEGSFDGKAVGNIIYADYTYKSEGKTSVREVAFRVNDNQVTEGFGDMEDKNGKMIFKDRSKINFNSGIKYNMIDCVENDSQFRISN